MFTFMTSHRSATLWFLTRDATLQSRLYMSLPTLKQKFYSTKKVRSLYHRHRLIVSQEINTAYLNDVYERLIFEETSRCLLLFLYKDRERN